ncbi:MAG: hypothetical protein E7542_00660, partial [Ruminococcaceae bacterium]|nr:hypothetical protein [Oscillospiraceae bacterium]
MKNKIYKLLSIVLSVMIVFSCCSVAITAYAEETTMHEYYISATGSDTEGDGSVDYPFLTVEKVISQAKLDGFNISGHTIVIYASNPNGATTNMWYASSNTFSFDCDVKVIGQAANTVLKSKGALTFDGKGSLTFKDVKMSSSDASKPLILSNKDLYIDEGYTDTYSQFRYIAGKNAAGNTTATDIQNIVLKSSVTHLYLGAEAYSATFANRFDLVYDVAGGTQTITFGGRSGNATHTTTFKNAINFNIKNGDTITFAKSANLLQFIENGQIQIINSAGATLSGLENIVNTVTVDGETTTQPFTKWILNNTTPEFKNALDFTETVGVYAVKAGYSVSVAKADAPTVVVATADATTEAALLNLTQYGVGTYNFTVTKTAPETKVVYVSATDGNSFGDGSETSPVTTIMEAIGLGKDAGLTDIDTLNVKTMGTAVNTGAISEYKFNLHVESADSNTKTTITVDKPVSYNNKDSYMIANSGAGTTARYSNVNITLPSSNRLSLNGTSAIFDSDVNITNCSGIAYKLYYASTTNTEYNGQTVEINSSFSADQRVYLNSINHGRHTFVEPINLVVNSTNVRYVQFTNEWGSATYTDVNIHLKNAHKSFAFAQNNTGEGATINGALQVIDSAGLGLSSDSTSSLTKVTANTKWFITNATGKKDAIDFTSTVGRYKVNLNSNVWTVKATDANDAVVATERDGYIDLSSLEAGAYTIIAEKKSGINLTYYVGTAGTETPDGSTLYTSVDEAIIAANADELQAGDTANIVLLSNATWFADTTTSQSTTHAFKVVISSYSSNKYTLKYNKYFHLSGDVDFENVTVLYGENWGEFDFGGNNVTFGEGTLGSNNGFAMGYFDGSSRTSDGQTVLINASTSKQIRLGNYSSGKITYSGDVNLILNNAAMTPTLGFTASGTGSSVIVNDNFNYNIIVKDAKTVTLSNTNNAVTTTIGGALQLIVNKPDTTTITDESISYISTAGTYGKGFYYIKNGTEFDDVISPVAADAGKYVVDVNNVFYSLKVTDASGNDVTANVVTKQGKGYYVSIPDAGTYTFTAERNKVTKTYYVGTAGTATPDSSTLYTSVDAAIIAANADGLTGVDTANIVLLSNATWFADTTTSQATAHAFKVVISSYSSNKYTLKYNKSIILAGDVDFNNVTVSYTDNHGTFCFGGNNITFGEGTLGTNNIFALGIFNANHSSAGQTVTINSNINKNIRLLNNNNSTITYSGDVNLILNNAAMTPKLGFTADYEGTIKLINNANFNIIVKDANTVTLGKLKENNNTVTIGGALQLIVNKPDTTTITDESISYISTAGT